VLIGDVPRKYNEAFYNANENAQARIRVRFLDKHTILKIECPYLDTPEKQFSGDIYRVGNQTELLNWPSYVQHRKNLTCTDLGCKRSGDTAEEIVHTSKNAGDYFICEKPELVNWVEGCPDGWGHGGYGIAPKGYKGTYLTFPVHSFMLIRTPKSKLFSSIVQAHEAPRARGRSNAVTDIRDCLEPERRRSRAVTGKPDFLDDLLAEQKPTRRLANQDLIDRFTRESERCIRS